jgi:hypothetical protein
MCSCVFCACDVARLLFVVFYVIRAVQKKSYFKIVTNERKNYVIQWYWLMFSTGSVCFRPTAFASATDFTHAVKVNYILLSKRLHVYLFLMTLAIYTTTNIAVDTPDLYLAVFGLESRSF